MTNIDPNRSTSPLQQEGSLAPSIQGKGNIEGHQALPIDQCSKSVAATAEKVNSRVRDWFTAGVISIGVVGLAAIGAVTMGILPTIAVIVGTVSVLAVNRLKPELKEESVKHTLAPQPNELSASDTKRIGLVTPLKLAIFNYEQWITDPKHYGDEGMTEAFEKLSPAERNHFISIQSDRLSEKWDNAKTSSEKRAVFEEYDKHIGEIKEKILEDKSPIFRNELVDYRNKKTEFDHFKQLPGWEQTRVLNKEEKNITHTGFLTRFEDELKEYIRDQSNAFAKQWNASTTTDLDRIVLTEKFHALSSVVKEKILEKYPTFKSELNKAQELKKQPEFAGALASRRREACDQLAEKWNGNSNRSEKLAVFREFERLTGDVQAQFLSENPKFLMEYRRENPHSPFGRGY